MGKEFIAAQNICSTILKLMISLKVGFRRPRKRIQMQGAQILRNEAYIEVCCNDEGCSATQPLGFAQGRESFDFAQDRELVERQMDFLRSRQSSLHHLLKCKGPDPMTVAPQHSPISGSEFHFPGFQRSRIITLTCHYVYHMLLPESWG